MEGCIALLRGINLGARNRVAMPALRDALSAAGFEGVRTYVQSGNVVLAGVDQPEELERRLERLIATEFGLEIGVVVRTVQELAKIVERNPMHDVATDPKRYQVTFLAEPLAPGRARELALLAAGEERFLADGSELYAWHPDGVARSRLWAKLGGTGLGVKATSRNWSTVTTLLEMASEE